MEIRFKLNPKNEKDKVIIDVLSGEYSPSETIKNILYKMGTNGAERKPMSFEGQRDYVNVSTGMKTNPIDGNEGNRTYAVSDNDKCQPMEDEDIAYYFSDLYESSSII